MRVSELDPWVMTALLSYDQVLSDLRARLKPVATQKRIVAQAIGHMAAEDLCVAAPVPAQAVALRAGYEMSSHAITGASSYAPVPLTEPLRLVTAGEALSPHCDCVVDASGIDLDGPVPQALVESFPGENLRRAGEDFAQGAMLLRAGEIISSQHGALLALAGVTEVSVQVPVVSVRGEASALMDFLRDHITHLGAVLEGKPDLIVDLGGQIEAPRLAFEPGADLALGEVQGVPVIYVPPRMDHIFAALHGFLRPLLGVNVTATRLPLAQKIASRVGVTELALLEAHEGQFHLIALGDLPLQSFAVATHVCLIAALSEGYAAGDVISADPVRA